MDDTDYSLPANHQKFIDMVVEAQNMGEKGQPVDMVVIDTYGNCAKTGRSLYVAEYFRLC